MTKSLLAIIIIAAVALAGCTGERHNRAFDGLDSIAETSPGVAVARLDSLCGVLPGLNRADSAYCAMVRLKAGLAAGLVPQSDSVALSLVDFYENELDFELLDDAYYTAAAVYHAMGNDAVAMDYLSSAMVNAHGADTLLMLRSQLMAGRIYLRNRLVGSADSVFRAVSASSVGRANRLVAASAIGGMGDVAYSRGRADSACHHYREALRLAPGNDGGGLAASLRCRLAEACVASGDTAAARRLLLQARAAATPALKPRLALAEGFLLEAEGRADTALLRYGEAAAGGDAATRSAAYGRMAAVYGGRGDGHKAADCAARCVALADSLAASVSAVGVGGVANRRWAERRELESFFKELCFDYFTEIWLYVVSAIALVAFVGFRAFLSHRRQQMHQKEVRHKYEPAGGMAADTAEAQRRRDGIEARPIYALIRQRLNSPNGRKRLSEDEWRQLAEAVNAVYPGFDSKLAELCKMSTADYRLCLLVKIEMSPSAMAQILVKTSSGITSARAKLFKRAFGTNGGAADWDGVIRSL